MRIFLLLLLCHKHVKFHLFEDDKIIDCKCCVREKNFLNNFFMLDNIYLVYLCCVCFFVWRETYCAEVDKFVEGDEDVHHKISNSIPFYQAQKKNYNTKNTHTHTHKRPFDLLENILTIKKSINGFVHRLRATWGMRRWEIECEKSKRRKLIFSGSTHLRW
jgi:hypothetical protein